MTTNEYFTAIKNRKGSLYFFILIFVLIALIVSFSQPLKYRATSRLIIIQDNIDSDPYVIARTNQYLGSLITETINSGSFFELVVSSRNSNIDLSYFHGDYKQQIKQWRKTINSKNTGDTGIITMEIYHPDPNQAKQLSIIVGNLLLKGSGLEPASNFSLKVIDQPTLSSWPVKPNVIINISLAIFCGLILGLIYIYFYPHGKNKLIQNKKSHINNNENNNSEIDAYNDYNSENYTGNIKNIIN